MSSVRRSDFITCNSIQVGKVSKAPVASTSKAPELVSRKPTLKPKTEAPAAKSAEKEKEQEKPAPLKPKASGKLDWSKAKTAGSDKSREKETKVKKESVSPAPPVKSNKTPPKADRDTSPQDESKVRLQFSVNIDEVDPHLA